MKILEKEKVKRRKKKREKEKVWVVFEVIHIILGFLLSNLFLGEWSFLRYFGVWVLYEYGSKCGISVSFVIELNYKP